MSFCTCYGVVLHKGESLEMPWTVSRPPGIGSGHAQQHRPLALFALLGFGWLVLSDTNRMHGLSRQQLGLHWTFAQAGLHESHICQLCFGRQALIMTHTCDAC